MPETSAYIKQSNRLVMMTTGQTNTYPDAPGEIETSNVVMNTYLE